MPAAQTDFLSHGVSGLKRDLAGLAANLWAIHWQGFLTALFWKVAQIKLMFESKGIFYCSKEKELMET